MINVIGMNSFFYKFFQTGTGDNRLNILYIIQQLLLSAPVELREHIIQQQHRVIFYFLSDQLNFGKFYRKRRGSLLPLRSEPSHIVSAEKKADIVAVRTVQRTFQSQLPVPIPPQQRKKLF